MLPTNMRSPKCSPMAPPPPPIQDFSQRRSHKDLYKTSPNWQLMYKKQCLSQLNDRRMASRSRLVERFRNIDINDKLTTTAAADDNNDLKLAEAVANERQSMVDEVMRDVWQQFTRQSTAAEELLPSVVGHQSLDMMSDLMEQIRQELLIEEGNYWEDLLDRRDREHMEWLLASNGY
ncbi:uncharacterized protein LOC128953481 [Oppia nitens]|uniref:uncharacterized protein LOC128953481 n=1 Tax=Oppia nitens TaxID=1686743 RepID=UPI0023DC45B6|nr:uncharacterized protein LOC128953481 [Oppia nitens]